MSLIPSIVGRLPKRGMDRSLLRLPSQAKIGEIVIVRALILHPMQGTLDGATPWYVQSVQVAFNGTPVCGFDWAEMISPNPYVEFSLRVPASGTLTLHWQDNRGHTGSAEAKIQAT